MAPSARRCVCRAQVPLTLPEVASPVRGEGAGAVNTPSWSTVALSSACAARLGWGVASLYESCARAALCVFSGDVGKPW